MTPNSIARLCASLGLALVAFIAHPSEAGAQGVALNQSELDTQVKLVSQEVTTRLLARSYPPALKRAGVTGRVQVQFVVDAAGKVEPLTIKVIDTTSPELADAAKAVVEEIKFKPGKLKGEAVRSVVVLPIDYR